MIQMESREEQPKKLTIQEYRMGNQTTREGVSGSDRESGRYNMIFKSERGFENVPANLQKTMSLKQLEADTADNSSNSIQVRQLLSDKKSDSTGQVTPLMSSGLKKTFVRSHNNLITIMEDPKDSSFQSPKAVRPAESLTSPRRNFKIEHLRLGFDANRLPFSSFGNAEPLPQKPRSSRADSFGRERDMLQAPGFPLSGTSRVSLF